MDTPNVCGGWLPAFADIAGYLAEAIENGEREGIDEAIDRLRQAQQIIAGVDDADFTIEDHGLPIARRLSRAYEIARRSKWKR